MPLEAFIKAKEQEIARLERLEQKDALPKRLEIKRPSLSHALNSAYGAVPALIAEYKRASPSRGLIRSDLEVEDVAWAYASAGATALSMLTEGRHFQGDLAYLARASKVTHLPLLRKDFIFHPLQVVESAAYPASAILLIVRLTPDAEKLRSLREQAESYGLEAVVEVFDAHDLELARQSGATLIQVNARDLASFKVDLQKSLSLVARHPPKAGETWIAASGISRAGELRALREAGFAAALIGTSLMSAESPGAALAALRNEAISC